MAIGALALAVCAGPASADCKLSMVAQLPVTMVGMKPTVPIKIEGQDVTMVTDSGAFFSMLTPQAVRRLGLKEEPAPFGYRIRGVGGSSDVKVVRIKDLTLLGYTFHSAVFLVAPASIGGGADGLLAQNIMNLFDVEYDLANGAIRLFRPQGCAGAPLAYWDKTNSYAVIPVDRPDPVSAKVRSTAKVNGVEIRVIFDTGAGVSTLTTKAAARAGVTLDTPGVQPAGTVSGIGPRAVDTWIAPFDSFALGEEQIKNTRLRIGAIDLEDADMLIGPDFFLSHRIFLSNSQRKMYFTYNGGSVFRLDTPPQTQAKASDAAPPSAAPAAGQTSDTPADADGFSRRGAAFMARRDFADAAADFSHAMELAPSEPRYAFERAMARRPNGQPFLAMGDLDQALKLKPDFVQALMARGVMRMAGHDLAGARTDFEAAAKSDSNMRLAIAGIYDGEGLQDDAIGQYDLWILAHPKDDAMAEALNGRCWARGQSGRDLDKALADCDGALKLKPHTSAFLDSRGLVRLRLGQFDGAITDYDEALKLQPKLAWSLYGRGLAELKKGLKAQGDADIQAATALAPRLPEEAKRHGIAPS